MRVIYIAAVQLITGRAPGSVTGSEIAVDIYTDADC